MFSFMVEHFHYLKMMDKRAITAVTSQKATENQALLISKPPIKCCHSNTSKEDTVLESPFCSKNMSSLPS